MKLQAWHFQFKNALRLLFFLQRYVLLKRKSYVTSVPKGFVISIIVLSIIFHSLQSDDLSVNPSLMSQSWKLGCPEENQAGNMCLKKY